MLISKINRRVILYEMLLFLGHLAQSSAFTSTTIRSIVNVTETWSHN